MPQRAHFDWTAEQRQRIEEVVDEYRVALHDSLNDLTEEEARRRLVPSKTTLLGLVKHAGFVEGVWFDQAITGRSYAQIGIARTVDGSFTLRKDDTMATVQAEYRTRWKTSRINLAGLQSDESSTGAAHDPSGPFSCKSSASLHNTPATPTSCVNRFSQAVRQGLHRRATGPDAECPLGRSSLGSDTIPEAPVGDARDREQARRRSHGRTSWCPGTVRTRSCRCCPGCGTPSPSKLLAGGAVFVAPVAERRGPEPLRARDRAAADIFSAADTDGPTGTTDANGSSPGDAMALFVIAVSAIEARRQNRADSG